MEQIGHNLLFRSFVGFSLGDRAWDHSTFTKDRDCLPGGVVARRSCARLSGQSGRADRLSKEHLNVDCTMTEAMASLKNFRPGDENGSQEGVNRNRWTDCCSEKLSRGARDCFGDWRCSNSAPHLAQNTGICSSAINGHAACSEVDAISQGNRNRIEEFFEWGKTISCLRKSRFFGREESDFQFVPTFAVYKLIWMRNQEMAACC